MAPGHKGLKSLGYFQGAAGSVDSATLLSALTGGTIPAGTCLVLITVAAQAIRWRDDGTNPSTTVGYPLAVGVELRYDSADFPRLALISQTAGAIVNIVCYAQP